MLNEKEALWPGAEIKEARGVFWVRAERSGASVDPKKEDGRVVQSADLSHSDGVVIENNPDGVPVPRTSSPTTGKPLKR